MKLQTRRSSVLHRECLSLMHASPAPRLNSGCRALWQPGEKTSFPSLPILPQAPALPWLHLLRWAFNQPKHLEVRLCMFVFMRQGKGSGSKTESEKQMTSWFRASLAVRAATSLQSPGGCTPPGPNPSELPTRHPSRPGRGQSSSGPPSSVTF